MANFKDAIARMLGITQNPDKGFRVLDTDESKLLPTASYDDALKLSDAYTTRGQDLYTDALAMSDAYNPTPKKKLTDILPKTEKKSGEGITAEKLGNIYKYILLPAMGIAETISSKGARSGETALAAMQAFDAGYTNRKAKEVADLKLASEKKEIARKDALRKQLDDLDSYKVATQADIDAIDVLSDIDYSGDMTPKEITVVSDDMFGDDYLVPSPVTVQTPNISAEKIASRKRGAMAKMLGVTPDKLVDSDDVIADRSQDAIEQYVKATDPLAYMKLKNDKSEAKRNKELLARQNYMTVLSNKDVSEPMKIDAAFQYFVETGKAPAVAPSANFTDDRMKQMYPRENIALGTQALANKKFDLDVKYKEDQKVRDDRDYELKLKNYYADLEKIKTGKMLPTATLEAIATAPIMNEKIDGLKELILNNKGVVGPLAGRAFGLANQLGLAIKETDTNALIDAAYTNVRQTIGKLKEGGVLRLEDEKKYLKMIGGINDRPETAIMKLGLIQDELNGLIESQKRLYQSQGYKIAGFDELIKPKVKDRSGEF